MTTTSTADPRLQLRPGVTLNKVPEVIAIFWIIKVLATTVGETAADYLNETLGFGLTNTTLVTAALFVVVIAVQLGLKRYVAPVYWLAVVLISVVGTLITDNLTDAMGVPLPLSTAVFTGLLALTFAVWYAGRADPVDPLDGRPGAARRSTGWRSCSPSPSAPPPAT